MNYIFSPVPWQHSQLSISTILLLWINVNIWLAIDHSILSARSALLWYGPRPIIGLSTNQRWNCTFSFGSIPSRYHSKVNRWYYYSTVVCPSVRPSVRLSRQLLQMAQTVSFRYCGRRDACRSFVGLMFQLQRLAYSTWHQLHSSHHCLPFRV